MVTLFAAGVSVAFAALTFSNTSIVGDSAFNAITGAASTTFDVGSGNTLSLQTTANGPITTGSGAFTIGGILSVANVDRAGSIAIGTSSATTITIGRAGQVVTFPGNASTTGTFAIGAGTPIVKHLSATGAITFGTIATSSCSTGSITVTGTNAGDMALAAPTPVASGIETVSSTWSAWATANTVNIRACNDSAANITPAAAQTWRVDVWQH